MLGWFIIILEEAIAITKQAFKGKRYWLDDDGEEVPQELVGMRGLSAFRAFWHSLILTGSMLCNAAAHEASRQSQGGPMRTLLEHGSDARRRFKVPDGPTGDFGGLDWFKTRLVNT